MKLIDKDALVAEIERIKKEECPIDSYEGRCKLLWFEQFLSFLNTLETKEVDINKEISLFIDTYFEKAKIGHKLSLKRTAKYFYELGLKAQKGE